MSVSLGVSQILIRHARVVAPEVSLSAMGWKAPLPPKTRSRAEALRLAEELAQRAQQAPDGFSELAAEFSEDPVTASAGGALGFVTATALLEWPQILDALSATGVGDVTHPVETEFGFHVLRRHAPPPEETRSGARIVIRHDDAPFLQYSARRPEPARSRAMALTLAQRVYEQARAAPDAFEQLVETYSDHEDAARGGYFGTWSNREPTPLSRELSTLDQLGVGEVSAPLDTAFGFQIIKRTKNRPRVEYAMTAIAQPFDPNAVEGSTSKKAVLEMTRALAREIAGDPKQLIKLQRQHCCVGVERIVEGRDPPALEAALARLAPGEVAREPTEAGVQYYIVRRLELSALPPLPATEFELPLGVPEARQGTLK